MNIQEREMLLQAYKEQLEIAEAEHLEEVPELEEVVKALIKTIPTEVKDRICPYCGRMIQIKKNFCPDCGQALR